MHILQPFLNFFYFLLKTARANLALLFSSLLTHTYNFMDAEVAGVDICRVG